MSEYQYVAFRAVDHPVSEKNLAYMRQQSTRAEITPWSFDNEYQFGDFRGDSLEMLRRGYDIYLHYANFGIRKLIIRLPAGLPDGEAVKPFLDDDELRVIKDRKGPGRCLCIEPYHEAGDLDELWEIDAFLDRLIPLRAEILDGDLRPFYLAHLAVACDSNHDPEETIEAPVPAGLGNLTSAQLALAELYGLSEALIAAAAQASPTPPPRQDPASNIVAWLGDQSESIKDGWLAAWMADRTSSVRSEMLNQFRSDRGAMTWPTVQPNRTIAQLQAAAIEIAARAKGKAAAREARQRANRLAKMAADPEAFLQEAVRLVAERSTDAYRRAAELLAELRDALSETGRSKLVEQQVLKLKRDYPTLHMLTKELRRHGLLRK